MNISSEDVKIPMATIFIDAFCGECIWYWFLVSCVVRKRKTSQTSPKSREQLRRRTRHVLLI